MGRVRKGKYLSAQAKEIINSCRLFCEDERNAYVWNLETHGNCNHTLVSLRNPIKRTSRACKVSRRAILRMKQELDGTRPTEEEEYEARQAAKKAAWVAIKKNQRKSTQMLGGYDLCTLRKTVHILYERYQKVPSLQSIYDAVREEIDFPWGQKTLRSNLNDLGFRWKETPNKVKYLMERSQIINNRSQFIRDLRNYRKEGFEIVFVGETWIPAMYSSFYHQQIDDELGKVHSVTTGERRPDDGQKIILLHAGCKTGFIPNCLLLTESNSIKRSKSDDTRNKEYENWLRLQLIPNLAQKSVVIQGNDLHHCVLSEVVPTSTATIDEIKHWLSSNYIPFSHDMLKAELLSLVKMHKPKPEYRSDLILKHAGFNTLHIPPFHVDFNPIELVWPFIKSYVATHNYSNTCSDMALIQQLFLDACHQAGRECWNNSCTHMIKTEDNYCRRDMMMESLVEKLVLGMYESDSSTDITSSDSDSETEGALNLPQMKRKPKPEPKPKGRPRKNKQDVEQMPKKSISKKRKKKCHI